MVFRWRALTLVEVFTYGNGVMLIALFQAIAALTATPDYMELIRIIFMVSTLVVMIEIVWTGRFKATARLFTIIILMNAAILATSDVNVVDQVNPANSGLVADVPAGLAVPLALSTAIGNWATGAFETIFSMPNALRYKSNGLLFASRLVENSTQFEITNARMAKNMSEFAQGCIYYGAMANWFSLDTVMESANIWAALPAVSFGNAIFVSYDDGGATNLWGCRDVRTFIEGDWAAAIDEMASVYGQRLFPQEIEAAAKAKLLSVAPQAYTYMAGISTSAANIIQQNAMMSTMRRSFTKMANSAGAIGAAQDYALAQAEAQQRTTYATLGAMAGRMMSLFSNVLETLIYGIFPIAFIFILVALMQGKAILLYVKLLFWLQLWPPMFAILNFAMSVYAAEATTAAAMQAGGGAPVLNMLTFTGIQAVNSDMSAMAGYLSWMIPMFSWAIVSGSGYAAAQLAGALGSVAQSSGSQASAAVSSGNLSSGNLQSGNHSYGNSQLQNSSGFSSNMFQDKSSPSMDQGRGSFVDSGSGVTTTTTMGGNQFHNVPQNSTPITANLASSLKSSVATSASTAATAAKMASTGMAATTASTFSNMQKLSSMTGTSQGTSSGSDSGSSSQFSQDFGKMDKSVSQFANDNNMSKGQAASMLLAASMDSNKMLAGFGFAAATGMSGSGKLSYSGDSKSNEAWSNAQKFAQDSGFGEKWSSAMQSGTKASEQLSSQSGSSAAKDISGGFSEQRAASSKLQSSMSEAQAWQSLSNRLEDQGASGGSNAVGAFLQFAQSPAGGGHSLQGLMSKMATMSSTSGDAAGATRDMNNLVAAFVKSEGAAMAGVQDAPMNNVSATNQSNQNDVAQATGDSSFRATGSGNIKAAGAGNQDEVNAAAEAAGVPSAGDVKSTAGEIRQASESQQAGINENIANGRAEVSQSGDALKDEATQKTEPGNQNHAANAIAQVGSAGIDTVVDAASGLAGLNDSGSGGLLGGLVEPHPDSPNGRRNSEGTVVGGSGDPNFPDLPPNAQSGNDQAVAGGKGEWVNQLE